MKNILKIVWLSVFVLINGWLSAQKVDKATFNEAVDYINCKVSELSMLDQIGQPNLVEYQTRMKNCDMSQFDGAFFKVLSDYFKEKRLGKNQQLATYINSFKTQYDSEKLGEDLFSLLMEELMAQQPIEKFRNDHSISFPPLEDEMAKNISELFQMGSSPTVIDDSQAIEGEELTFRDTTQKNTYIHQDGGAANEEQVQDDEEGRVTKPERTENDSIFAKYRWHIFFTLLIAAFGYFWFTRGSNLNINNPIQNGNGANGKDHHSKLTQLQAQLNGLQSTSQNLEEELTVLKHRIDEFENRINDDAPVETVQVKTNNAFIEDIDEEAIQANIIEDEELETGNVMMTLGTSFYLPVPTTNGVFDMKQATTVFKRPYSFYLFTITSADGQQAEFKIYEDIATMLRALDNFDEYVRPACRSTAILHKNATKIITEENGLAIKDGNQWKVVTKAVIRYA